MPPCSFNSQFSGNSDLNPLAGAFDHTAELSLMSLTVDIMGEKGA